VLDLLGKLFIKAIGGTRNERIVRARMKYVTERVNPLEARMRALSDEQMRELGGELRRRLGEGQSRDDVKAEAFALVREASRRARNHRQFDVQLVAGMVLDDAWIAEEATGEGKTIACYPAVFMAVLEGMHAHVVTVNDYLVQRDAEFARPIFELLGVTVGYITQGMDNDERKTQYACDVTYGTNSEFGFDYLRDNMKLSVDEQVQGPLDFAIIDEVDSILIDEARTPLIISGGSGSGDDDKARYKKADELAVHLTNLQKEEVAKTRQRIREDNLHVPEDRMFGPGMLDKAKKKFERYPLWLTEKEAELLGHKQYFVVQQDSRSAHITHEGVTAAQAKAGVGNFYVGKNMDWPHLISQALRARLVYEKGKDYVVRDGQVVIVDEFTGRLLEGRQWSDGLHQAVEAKEPGAEIKEETQTLATITIQNFFRLYKKLAGMTGTAMTEANEFVKIYKLDVVAVPTHRPVNRSDHEDRIYAEVDDKYKAIVEEVNRVSKTGRPVLVGTTSIEKSEKLSNMLTRTYGVEHQLLNGRPENAARESEIVTKAGQQRPLKAGSKQMVGMVTIATNMAGRGTDIKLGDGVVYDKCRVPSAEKLAELGVEAEDLFPPGATKCCINCPQYDPSTNCAHCFKPKLDSAFPQRGRGECPKEVPCGLHIVGTERHEARRIDNQLRGRSGRQGDPGSSRFFLSIRDDLLAVFAGEWTLKVLSWLGLEGDQAIEDKRISKGIERAQKKVEERNFETRKHLLEYDEVMDHQRRQFYQRRQEILQGMGLDGLVMEMIADSVAEAVDTYLDKNYPKQCIAEWARQNLQIPVRDDQIRAASLEEMPDLQNQLRELAKEETASTIAMTLGEYMDESSGPEEWDLRGLSGWAMSRFNVNFSQNQLRKMTPQEVSAQLYEAAAEKIDQITFVGLGRYLEESFPAAALGAWVRNKFDIEIPPERLTGGVDEVQAAVMEQVEQAYRRREIEYPVEYAMEMTLGAGGEDNVYALGALVDWAKAKYDLDWTAEQLQDTPPQEIRRRLIEASEAYLAGGRLEEVVRSAVGGEPDVQPAIQFAKTRFQAELSAEDFDGDVFGKLVEVGSRFLRREMTELERFVLLQIYDGAWKDHLLAMDHLKGGIGLRQFAQQDPRVAYKREGARQFDEMHISVRDKVTDNILKVRLSAGEQMSSVYRISSMVHEQLSGYDHLAQDVAAQAAATSQHKPETIKRGVPKVGRNDPCPCGSGKKYKKCCGKNV